MNTGSLFQPAASRPPQSAVPIRLRRRVRWTITLILLLAVVVAGAWSLRGKGYLYALKVSLGLATPQRSPVDMSGGSPAIPKFDRAQRTYEPLDPALRFEKVPLPITADVGYTCVLVGPDGCLWAASDDGRLFRFPIAPDGTLGSPRVFNSLQNARRGLRLVIGFCFGPESTPEAPVLYVTHNTFAFHGAPDWSGALTRLSGPDLAQVQDLVIGLPRSTGDHATNQPAFGPDGALYIPQASNTAFGDPDDTWGMRPERRLNASILRLDLSQLPTHLPLDVQTEEGGAYNPEASGAPLTIYASGVRLAYDLCWARDGRLYAPVNGSSAGGNAPAAPDGSAPPLRAIPSAEPDWLVRIERGRYYGHPNPRAGHYVLNGGNPTEREDPAETREYPVGTLPDPRWHAPIANFGDHQSPNGIIQFSAAGHIAGERALDGALVLCRYSFGGDLIAVRLTAAGDVGEILEGIPGFTGFANPLDITQDPRTGYLYVSDYGAREVVLVRPHVAAAN